MVSSPNVYAPAIEFPEDKAFDFDIMPGIV